MARRKKCRVFVSYSRHDETLVKPLAGLLGAAGDDAIFLDVNSIQPGDSWKTEIEQAIKDASVFIVCWCCECEQSTFIAYEIQMALASGEKRLVPVLLCSSPLPAKLSDRQWIDLRGHVVHVCNHGMEAAGRSQPQQMPQAQRFNEPVYAAAPPTAAAPGPARPLREPESSRIAPSRGFAWWMPAGAVAILVVAFVLYFGLSAPRAQYVPLAAAPAAVERAPAIAPARPSRDHSRHPLAPEASSSASVTENSPSSSPAILISILVVATIAALLLVRRIQRRRHHQQADEIAAKAKSYFEGLGKHTAKR